MAAKRYRGTEHRTFHRAATYTEGRSVKRSRDDRALKRKSTWGKIVAAGEWAVSEWDALKRVGSLGLPVPYPVQIDGHRDPDGVGAACDGETAPRLAQTRPEPALLASLLRPAARGDGDDGAGRLRARRPVGVQHPGGGDAAGDHRPAPGRRPGRQPGGLDFLLRDCTNVCTWFRSKGLDDVDEHELFGDLMAHAF